MAKVMLTIFTTDYPDFTERIDRNFIHLLGESSLLFNLFKISVISEISGSYFFLQADPA